ncbi:LVIVD repeat-containing protein [Capnocytophaga cynodegmi]|uniref:LVIVD repeat-containing protein n=1 Tax=Capnocytophaga cynodegmi TaxID=28189 RepID=UPI00385CE089
MRKIFFVLLFVVMAISCSKESNNDAFTKSSDSVGGSLATFSLVGDYLYVVDSGRLNVFSVQNPTNPSKVNTIYVGFDIETLFSLNEFLFIGSRSGMYIYSIEKPESPEKLSEYRHFNACDPVVANASHAFVTLHSNSFCGNNLNVLQVYDIGNLKNPVKIHERNLTQPKGLALKGDYLVICDDDLKFFDIKNPANPTLVHSENKSFKDVIFYENKLFAFGEREITQYAWTKEDFSDLYVISTTRY